jgi:hypothetical protein
MSRSNPTTTSSPATRYFEWSAEKGTLQYYDKEAKENVPVKLPFAFLILDEVSQVGGGVKVHGKYEGYWSNMAKNLQTQPLTVKSKAGVVAQGLWADLKERKGLHYVKGLFIAFHGDDKVLQIGYLKFKGSALGAWFDYTKTHRDLFKGAFVIQSRSEVVKGDKGDYYTPVFHYKADISEESDNAAEALDATVQEYLTTYFAQNAIAEVEHAYSGNGHSSGAPPEFDEHGAMEPPDDDIGAF